LDFACVKIIPGLPVSRRTTPIRFLMAWLLLFSIPQLAVPRPAVPAKGAPAQSANAASPTQAADEELQNRLRAAAAARDSGDPGAVARANSRVLALAYRKLANVRIAESAFAQANALLKDSLSLGDEPETHVALAICALYTNRPDDSLAEAAKALALDPGSARAFNIQGKAWMKKRDYRKAVESLQKSVQIQPEFEPAYALGVAILSTKDPDSAKKAAEVFDSIVASLGDSGSLHVMFGHAFRDAEMQDDSIRELRKAVALDTRTPHAHYFLGLAMLWKNEWTDTPEIRQEFVTELNYFPKDFLANYFLGYLDSNDRRYDEAEPHLKAAAAIDPTWPEPWLFLGLNTYAQGDMKRSETYLRKCIELTGKDESRGNYQVRRAYITLGRILNASGRAEEAAPYLEKARFFQQQSLAEAQQQVAGRASDEGSVSPAAVVALLDRQEGQPVPLSTESIDPTQPLDSASLARAGLSEDTKKAAIAEENQLRLILGTSFNDLATSEAVRRDYLAALQHYQDAERWDSSISGLLRNLGVAAFRVQNYQECVRALSHVVQDNSEDAAARAMLGSAYFALENYRQAAIAFTPLGDRAVHDSTLGYAWAASLFHLGDSAQATRVLEEYEELDLTPETLVLVGQLWSDMTDYARAMQAFHRALDRDPALVKAHAFAGMAQLRWEHPGEAQEEFSAALKLAPDDPDATIGLGYIYVQQGKQAEAIDLLRSVATKHPENGNAHYQLGKLLLDGGKTQEAVTQLEAAVRELPQTYYVHYQLQAAYRKESRMAEADHELQIYKELKAKNRASTVPRSMEGLMDGAAAQP
jgi:tetratricopeptide (TPR) repeat protein